MITVITSGGGAPAGAAALSPAGGPDAMFIPTISTHAHKTPAQAIGEGHNNARHHGAPGSVLSPFPDSADSRIRARHSGGMGRSGCFARNCSNSSFMV
jgi:hypothetical protein